MGKHGAIGLADIGGIFHSKYRKYFLTLAATLGQLSICYRSVAFFLLEHAFGSIGGIGNALISLNTTGSITFCKGGPCDGSRRLSFLPRHSALRLINPP
jgi:hypothetical protein